MLICRDCFADIELRSEVETNAVLDGECEVCHSKGKLIDSSEFDEFFSVLLALFEPSESGETVSEIIQKDWHLFANVGVAEVLLSNVLERLSLGYEISDKVGYSSDISDRVSIWARVKRSVKYKSRFFTSMDEFAQYDYLQSSLSLSPGHASLYRSRITPEGKEILSLDEMYCPNKTQARAGRANPIGIPYLYLSDSAKTTYFEVRAVYLDRLSVGEFKIARELNLVDFKCDLNLWLDFADGTKDLRESVIKKKVIDDISRDLSKPLRRYDSELEYVPTQLICEYCKEALQADGICYGSSLYKEGVNYVLFNQDMAKCVGVEAHEITKIDIDR